ncbi:MAG: helical backbone metal receptor [Candidatus Limnocylindrales bacterium]
MFDVIQAPSRQPGRGRSLFGGPAALLTALLLAACSAAASPAATPTPTATTAPVPTASASPVAIAAFPVTLTDDEGTVVTLASMPQRIVSLSPANTETIFALGAGARLVGGTDADDYPSAAAAITHVATYQGVLMEQLVTVHPDLVLALGNGAKTPPDVIKIRDMGIPVLVLYAADVPGVLHDIELIGAAVGAGPEAFAITSAMQARIRAISAVTAPLEHPRTFYELGADPVIYGPAKGNFTVGMIALAGGDAVVADDDYTISLEKLVTADPQVIVLGDANYGTTPAQVAARPGWAGISAVKTGALRPVDDIIVTRPGPRLAEGLAALALAIHPDLVLP